MSIFEGVEKNDFDANFIEISPNLYKVLNSTYFKGRYIYKDDVFRFEDVKKEDLKIALEDFMNLTKNRFDEIIFYTLKYKNKFDLENLIKGKI